MENITQSGPGPRRRLNKEEITEILERNITLFKDKENFLHYLVELAIHLLEYEYDWSESGSRPANLNERTEDLSPKSSVDNRNGRLISTTLNPSARNSQPRNCRICGEEVGDRSVCPKCHNLAR